MGHDTLVCPKCKRLVMEGSGDWECCGMICDYISGFIWVTQSEYEELKKKSKEKTNICNQDV